MRYPAQRDGRGVNPATGGSRRGREERWRHSDGGRRTETQRHQQQPPSRIDRAPTDTTATAQYDTDTGERKSSDEWKSDGSSDGRMGGAALGWLSAHSATAEGEWPPHCHHRRPPLHPLPRCAPLSFVRRPIFVDELAADVNDPLRTLKTEEEKKRLAPLAVSDN